MEFYARQRSPLGPQLVSSTTQSGDESRAGPIGATYTAQFNAQGLDDSATAVIRRVASATER